MYGMQYLNDKNVSGYEFDIREKKERNGKL